MTIPCALPRSLQAHRYHHVSSASSRPVRGRLAPSPTGYMHLGNAWAFLLAWLAVRSAGGTLVLRMEDIDPQRSRPEYARALVEDLRWLGLDWDEGPAVDGAIPADGRDMVEQGPCGPYFQSARTTLYAETLDAMGHAGLVYPCYCTRKELRQLAGAPHVDDAGAPYPGTCRHLGPEERRRREAQGRRACLRLCCPEGRFRFQDALLGEQSFSLEDCGGDFALRRSDGVVAYQLAVALDDALMGITQVVRGRDILTSTPRQLALLGLWGFEPPTYAHIPLLLDGQGERLAKRHQSLGVRELRRQGVAAADIVGVLALLAGLRPDMRPLAAAELLADFRLERLPRHDVCLRDLPCVPDWLRPLCLPC
ncbi:tRNA glutamyl-Q(34) synthetase GluQRS [uncultured Desulfovibrio sp.]|uniref:tRNA glutamyl-Q(34) synthetase GluQRS n=1 Tax=uncultured Desulfovibrio sp. TaxID=167968 RepID=UPI00265D4340|nr:tRNA glutamyl-Q(34) synthetase GluQRS [uncultured Desulfovibrio sp.]